MKLEKVTVGFTLSIGCLLSSVLSFRAQEIQFFKDKNFKEKLDKFFTSETADHSSSPVWKQAKSHCVIRGLWRIFGTFNSNPNLTFVEIANGNDNGAPVCGSWNSKNQTAQYKSIKLIGSRDMDTPGLTLNIKPRFDAEELFFEGTYLGLPKAFKFKSYGFTGTSNWTIYEQTDFSGKSECLVANKGKGVAVTFSTNKTMIVGSIWRGCDGGTTRAITSATSLNHTKKKSTGCDLKMSFSFLAITVVLGLLFIQFSNASF